MRPLLLIVVVVVVAAGTSSCAGTLGALGIGYERGKANVVVRGDDATGIVYAERYPNRPPRDVVVMLHGFGGSKDHWTRFVAQLPNDLWLIAPDLPGFGESKKDPAVSYDYASQIARLEQFFKRRNVVRFHLLAHSMGGAVAVRYALAHPEQVQSLVLFDPTGIEPPQESAMDKLTKGNTVPLVIETAADFDRLIALSFVHPPELPEFIKEHFAKEAQAAYAFNKKIKADIMQAGWRIEQEVHELRPPTLVVWGGKDQIIDPSVVPLWRRRSPDHDVVVVKDTGHAPMLERPAESAALVQVWWARLQRRR